MTIVEFLTERLDEDQAQAEAAAKVYGACWETSEHSEDVHGADGGYVACGPYDGYLVDELRYFIARHDPAAAIADVASKRGILADYTAATELCDQIATGLVAADVEGVELAETERVVLRRSVVHLASAYRDHLDWQDW